MERTRALRVALVGYGRMGQMIEKILLERGHSISIIIQAGEGHRFDDESLLSSDVAIEFTHPTAAFHNCSTLLDRGIPVVSGTTGWNDGVQSLAHRVRAEEGKTFFWSSNFSLGVNLFFELNRQMARLMQGYPEYKTSIQETHHIHKLDAPSGTAITLAETILSERSDLDGWALSQEQKTGDVRGLPIESIRKGEVPGIHQVRYLGGSDEITLTHEAFGRESFALGAVLAAEYAHGHRGFLTMQDLIKL